MEASLKVAHRSVERESDRRGRVLVAQGPIVNVAVLEAEPRGGGDGGTGGVSVEGSRATVGR